MFCEFLGLKFQNIKRKKENTGREKKYMIYINMIKLSLYSSYQLFQILPNKPLYIEAFLNLYLTFY